jgi:hypothetical protein
MVYGIYLATKTRNVPRAYNESKLMAFSLYNISFTVLIGILLIYLTQSNDDLNTPYITQVLVILWCCMWTASALIVPRIYYLIYPPGPDFFAAHVRKASQGVQRRSGGKESALSGMGASQSNLNASTLPRPTPLPSTAAKQPANSSKVPAPMARKPLPVAAIPKGKKDAVELQAIQHTSQPNPAMMEEGPSSPSTSTSTLSPVGGVKLPRKVSLHDLNLHLPSPVNVAELAAAGMEEHVAQETRRASTFGGGAKVKDSKLLPQGTSSDDYEPEEDDVRPPVPSEPYPSDVPARAGSTPPPSAAASSSSAHAGDDEEAVVHSGTSVPDVVSPFALKKQVHRPSVDFTPASQPPPPEDSSEEED